MSRGGLASAGLAALLLLAATGAVAGSSDLPDPRWRAYLASMEPHDSTTADRPPSAFSPGRSGRALRVDKRLGSPELVVPGVVDLSRPGAITCFVKASGWRAPSAASQYLAVLRVVGTGSAVAVVERDVRPIGRKGDVWIAGFFSMKSRGDVSVQQELTTRWTDDAWHFLAFQWDATGFTLRLDDLRPVRTASANWDLGRDFPRASSRLVVGSTVDDGILVDELSVWTRPLTNAELDAIRRPSFRATD